MQEPKFDMGDVAKVVDSFSMGYKEKLVRVTYVASFSPTPAYEVEFENGERTGFFEDQLEGVPLEEVQQYYADKPRDGFIVDGLLVDEMLVNELEDGQEEAYEIFQTAAKEANREEERRAAEDDRKERRVIAELAATAILWAVFTLVSLVMWLVVMWTGGTAYAPIGYHSAVVSVIFVIKPMGALIIVCKERIEERKKRKEEP